jgi:hypothetical protein
MAVIYVVRREGREVMVGGLDLVICTVLLERSKTSRSAGTVCILHQNECRKFEDGFSYQGNSI